MLEQAHDQRAGQRQRENLLERRARGLRTSIASRPNLTAPRCRAASVPRCRANIRTPAPPSPRRTSPRRDSEPHPTGMWNKHPRAGTGIASRPNLTAPRCRTASPRACGANIRTPPPRRHSPRTTELQPHARAPRARRRAPAGPRGVPSARTSPRGDAEPQPHRIGPWSVASRASAPPGRLVESTSPRSLNPRPRASPYDHLCRTILFSLRSAR